jgi:hypothetical protein
MLNGNDAVIMKGGVVSEVSEKAKDGQGGKDREQAKTEGLDFIRTIITEDLASGKHAEIVTRFPPNRMAISILGTRRRSV